MSNPEECFNRIADAINRDGNSAAHQEAALAAQLYGVGFGSMFDCFNKAWNGDSQQQRQQRSEGRGGGGDPFSSVVFGCLNRLTEREMQRMQQEIDDALRRTIF